MAHTACLVCFISDVHGGNQKQKPWETGASSGHITNFKQSIFDFQYLPIELKLLRISQVYYLK